MRIRVDVRSKFAGHGFPTGFTAERQAWVALTVCDPSGVVVYSSGDLDQNADLRDEHSHDVLTGRLPYDRRLLNFQSKFIALSHKGTERSVVISVNRNLSPLSFVRPADGAVVALGRPTAFRIAKGNLPPLQTMGQSYDIRVSTPGIYQVKATLNFRHLPPTLLDHIGTPHLKHLLQIVVVDEQRTTFQVE
jgi:hypothetical protein